MAGKFPNLVKHINLQIKKFRWIPNLINPPKIFNITIKLLGKNQNTTKHVCKAARRKSADYTQGTNDSRSLPRNGGGREKWNIFKVLTEKNCHRNTKGWREVVSEPSWNCTNKRKATEMVNIWENIIDYGKFFS